MNARMEAGFAKAKVSMDRDFGEMDKALGRAEDRMHSLSCQVKAIWGVMLVGFMVYMNF